MLDYDLNRSAGWMCCFTEIWTWSMHNREATRQLIVDPIRPTTAECKERDWWYPNTIQWRPQCNLRDPIVRQSCTCQRWYRAKRWCCQTRHTAQVYSDHRNPEMSFLYVWTRNSTSVANKQDRRWHYSPTSETSRWRSISGPIGFLCTRLHYSEHRSFNSQEIQHRHCICG